jgi:simple sugar transport system ATP-binding protein
VLSPVEADDLLRILAVFAIHGNAVVMVTHKLREALAASHSVTVLRHGAVTYAGNSDSESAESLARAMLGSNPAPAPVPQRRAAGKEMEPAIRAQVLDVGREGRYGMALRGATLSVMPGEILGIAAVEGAGQRELMRSIAGLVEPLRGTLRVAQPVAFIPEDRTSEGLIPALSLAENLVLGLGASGPGVQGGFVSWSRAAAGTAELLDRFGITAAGPEAAAGSLSGGNQQKLMLARALESKPRVIVAENPTRGLDVAASAEVHARLRWAADEGVAVLFHSSDLDEVLLLAHRVAVMAGGVLLSPPAPDRDVIGRMMVGAD